MKPSPSGDSAVSEMNFRAQCDKSGGDGATSNNRSGSGNSSSGDRSDDSEDGGGGDNTEEKKRLRRKHRPKESAPETSASGKLALNLSTSVSGFSVSCSSSSTASLSSSSSAQIRRYGMGTEGTDSPSSSALKLPRTLSTSVLKVKYRSSFWEKFWEERSKRDM